MAKGQMMSETSCQPDMRSISIPCNMERDHVNLDMYLDVLSEISLIRMKYADISHSKIGGDFNTDLSRRSSLQTITNTTALLYYLPREGLTLCSQCTDYEILYIYENRFTGAQSKLDHLILSESFSGDVNWYCSIHEGDNLSDHCPIIMNIAMNIKYDHSQNR